MTVKDDDQYRLSTNTEVSKVGSWSFDFGKRLFFATNETYLIFGRRSDEFDGGMHQILAEKIVLGGLTHSDVGAWLCKKWQFRDDITEIVLHHHTPLLSESNSVDTYFLL